jgi:hypothetical protein
MSAFIVVLVSCAFLGILFFVLVVIARAWEASDDQDY